jgi:protocatechuate 3,4-dioxygenase beta subunit
LTDLSKLELGPDLAVNSQLEISTEIASQHQQYQKSLSEGSSEEHFPKLEFSPYRSSIFRHPTKDLVMTDPETIELLSPVFGHTDVASLESDLTRQERGEPIGERIIVTGRLLDGDGRPVRRQLIEIWQANSAGRYIHKRDRHPAPIDPFFSGMGRTITDDQGNYRFVTIKPGPYPWKNHHNAWRPAHIHFSVFGDEFTQRIVTQMYFPGDPLFALDPIYQSIRDQKARDRLVANYDHQVTEHEWATGYNWDIVLSGSNRTWFESEEEEHE